jgi:hypothetical protein
MNGKALLEVLEERGLDTEDGVDLDAVPSFGTTAVHVAADVGNAMTKLVLSGSTGKPLIWTQPTAKANFGLDLPDKLPAEHIVLSGSAYATPMAIGDAALQYAVAPVASRLSDDRYGSFVLDFILGGIAALTREAELSVDLACLCPAELAGFGAPDALKKLRGTYAYEVHGRPYRVKIKSVRVYREGESAVWSCLPQHSGKAIVIDIGGGTTHVALAVDGVFRSAKTRTTGLQLVIDTIDAVVSSSLRRKLTVAERYELERSIVRGEPHAALPNQSLRERANEIVRQVGNVIAADVKQIVPAYRTADIVVVGGGSYMLQEVFREQFGDRMTIAKRPELANVFGALQALKERDKGI